MRNVLLMLLVFILLLSPARNEAYEGVIINLEEGNFIIKDIVIAANRFGILELKGNIVNNTAKDWTEAAFEICLFDKAGNKLKVDIMEEVVTVKLYNIKKDETQAINEPLAGEFLTGLKKNAVSRFEVRFKEGKYPAKYLFVMTKPKENKELTFEDSYLNSKFLISKKQIGFVLYNKTGNPIKIDWNQISYVDTAGVAHKIIHEGVKYTEKDNLQPLTVIPPTAKLEDLILPSDCIYYYSGQYATGWRTIPLFPEAPAAKNFKGCSFSIFMPLEINGGIQNYFFTFKIEDIDF